MRPAPAAPRPAERHLLLLLRTYLVAFPVVGCLYLLLPDTTFAVMNAVSQRAFPSLPLIPDSAERFWLTLTFSLLLMLAAQSYLVQQDIRRNFRYVWPLLVAKLASAACYLALFLFSVRYFAYLVGCLMDSLLFLLTALLGYRVWKLPRP